jgi:hypothetical protein
VRPSREALDQVHQWLQDNNISESKLQYSSAKDWIKVTLPVSSVEQLLDTKYSVYKHTDGTHLIRTPKWSLPLHLHEHIETIQPTNSFLRPRAKKTNLKTLPTDDAAQYAIGSPFVAAGTTVEDVCNVTAVTPLCLRTLYGTSTLFGRLQKYMLMSIQELWIILLNPPTKIRLASPTISAKQTTAQIYKFSSRNSGPKQKELPITSPFRLLPMVTISKPRITPHNWLPERTSKAT